MWFITVLEKIAPVENSFPQFGDTRTWGFYSDRETAVQALHENRTDMWEYCYNYAVLEQFNEGISHYVFGSNQWFEFDREREGYFEIDTPECVKNIGCFALG